MLSASNPKSNRTITIIHIMLVLGAK
uniref:Uncharacterized protein n=1 Tax=Rhizophora mucronata TaxID=61149 RepID=A0A2P2PDC0_RHIMU